MAFAFPNVYYIKLEPKEGSIDGFGIIKATKGEKGGFKHGFGSFASQHLLMDSNDPRRWAVVEFYASSRKTDTNSTYDTDELALQHAIRYLNTKGFNAVSFDLEGMVEQI